VGAAKTLLYAAYFFFPALTFAHLALCGSAIFRREAAEIIRFAWLALRRVSEPFNDSIAEIA
jgi:hypothetical protein